MGSFLNSVAKYEIVLTFNTNLHCSKEQVSTYNKVRKPKERSYGKLATLDRYLPETLQTQTGRGIAFFYCAQPIAKVNAKVIWAIASEFGSHALYLAHQTSSARQCIQPSKENDGWPKLASLKQEQQSVRKLL